MSTTGTDLKPHVLRIQEALDCIDRQRIELRGLAGCAAGDDLRDTVREMRNELDVRRDGKEYSPRYTAAYTEKLNLEIRELYLENKRLREQIETLRMIANVSRTLPTDKYVVRVLSENDALTGFEVWNTEQGHSEGQWLVHYEDTNVLQAHYDACYTAWLWNEDNNRRKGNEQA